MDYAHTNMPEFLAQSVGRQIVDCPFCGSGMRSPWASENGWTLSKCSSCGFLYLAERPEDEVRAAATRAGDYSMAGGHTLTERPVAAKRVAYRRIIGRAFADVWSARRPISWLDVGAGHGEVVEAISSLAISGSTVMGFEPMLPKADSARLRGIDIRSGEINDLPRDFGFVSMVNVFSHVHDFDGLLAEVSARMKPDGQLFLETGDMSRVGSADELMDGLDLPDHVQFAGERHIRGFLQRGGFDVVAVTHARRGGISDCLRAAAKWSLGGTSRLRLPYSSGLRSIRLRARKR